MADLTLKERLTTLLDTPPLEPRGWFRWLHYHFLGRYAWGGDHELAEAEETHDWLTLAGVGEGLDAEEEDLLLRVMQRHAWMAGRMVASAADSWRHLIRDAKKKPEEETDEERAELDQWRRPWMWQCTEMVDLTPLGKFCWARLGPTEKGIFLAGFSGEAANESWPGIKGSLEACAFHPDSLCELACNAIRMKHQGTLHRLLKHADPAVLRAEIHRADAECYPKTHYPEMLASLSHRVIDMILEAALVKKDAVAARVALQQGADPNLRVWRLERSYNEKHCALSYALDEEMPETARLLLSLGANPKGTDFVIPNLPLFQALAAGDHEMADELLRAGASFARLPTEKTPPAVRGGEESMMLHVSGEPHYFHIPTRENRALIQELVSMLPLTSIAEKQSFYHGNGQGGYWVTFLDVLVGNVSLLRRYEAMGLDTRLTEEELDNAVYGQSYDGLHHLLVKHGSEELAEETFRRILKHRPDFGTLCREPEAQHQENGINAAREFKDEGWPALSLERLGTFHMDLGAIAPPDHSHGPTLEKHFWLREETSEYERIGEDIVMTELKTRWAMAPIPPYEPALKNVIPCVKQTAEGRFIKLGIAFGNLGYRLKGSHRNAYYRFLESAEFARLNEEAWRRVRAQDAANARPKKPALTEEELLGYPAVFWPYLVRLPTGFIGMTTESCAEDPDKLDLYQVWARQNKTEDSFYPEPRMLDWPAWREVPVEFRPFFVYDEMFGRPGVRHDARNDYEKAMIHKAVMWWNGWIAPQMLAVIEEMKEK